ncbi:MAG: Maf family nucleotide pyrophosphatase [Bacteroidota bacterium]
MQIFDKKIVLASKSPRRAQLLSEAGFQYEIRTKEVEEDYPEGLSVEEVPKFLARKKAHSMLDDIGEDEIILAADSIVALGTTIYGKPKNEAEAEATLRQLSGQQHQVITGVCLLNQQKEKCFAGISNVYFGELNEEEIQYYIHQFQPFDKAGAYGIQEWIGWCKIEKIEGTFANIMGLPTSLVYAALQDW